MISFLVKSVLETVRPLLFFSLIRNSYVLPRISSPFAPDNDDGKNASLLFILTVYPPLIFLVTVPDTTSETLYPSSSRILSRASFDTIIQSSSLLITLTEISSPIS